MYGFLAYSDLVFKRANRVDSNIIKKSYGLDHKDLGDLDIFRVC
jgi:hypothetical protein